jgi:hypothetical protein
MSKIVDLEIYRAQALELRCFGAWEKRFNEKFSLSDRVGDISDKTLYQLACPGDDSNQAFYEIIMGSLDLGSADTFGFLEDEQKLRVIEIHLFLVDIFRFELMRRLDWLTCSLICNERIVELVQQVEKMKARYRNQPLKLAVTHPAYENYRNLIPREKEAFIRGLLTSALDTFSRRV